MTKLFMSMRRLILLACLLPCSIQLSAQRPAGQVELFCGAELNYADVNFLRLYDILGCQGIIRTDYILTEGWQVNLLEVNTTPGMTATSFIPQQVRAAGIDIKDVLTDIIEDRLQQ
jgi:hypothetical protein